MLLSITDKCPFHANNPQPREFHWFDCGGQAAALVALHPVAVQLDAAVAGRALAHGGRRRRRPAVLPRLPSAPQRPRRPWPKSSRQQLPPLPPTAAAAAAEQSQPEVVGILELQIVYYDVWSLLVC